MSFYSENYDPLYANGILPAPVDRILNENLPVKIDYFNNYPLNSRPQKDTFIPQEKKSNWKAWALGALATVLVFAGLKKCGINPFKKLADKPILQTIKTKATNVYTTVFNFIKSHLSK